MASSSEHQGLQIAVIIFALLTIIMSGATFYVFKLSEDAELRAAESNRKSQEDNNALRVAIAEIEEYRKMMGTEFDQPTMKLEDAKKIFTEDMAAHANTFPPEKQKYADALEELKVAYTTLSEQLKQEREAVQKQGVEIANATKDKQATVETHRTAAAAAEDGKKDATVKLAEVTKKLNDEKQELAKEVQRVTGEYDQYKQKAAADAKKATDEIAVLKLLNEGKQKDLDELQQKTFVSSDGEITWVSAQTKSVWINIGRDDGLKKGVTFSVYGLDQNGVARGEPKGSIQVTQILGAHMAEATIQEDTLSDPILIRDQLYTPLWHPGRQEQFALCGLIDMDKDGVSDVGFIKDLIRRHGGTWVAELMPDGSVATQDAGMTLKTRYMIVGEPFPNVSDEYGKMLGDAKQLGVEALSVEKFLDYVGWKDTAKVVNFGRDSKQEDFLYDPNQDRARRPAASSAGANNFRRREPPRAHGERSYQER